MFKFENCIINELIVFKMFKANGSNNRTKRFYIYGAQNEIAID